MGEASQSNEQPANPASDEAQHADAESAPPAPGATTRDLVTSAPVIGDPRQVTASGIRSGDGHRVCDVALDGTVAGRHHVAAASWIGLGHVAIGSCRQDAYNFCLDQRDRLYVAVADGLGSRSVSHLGARIFCEETMRAACGCDGESLADPATLIAIAGRNTAKITKEVYGIDPREAGCVAVVGAFSQGRHEFARVGDATAFVLSEAAFIELFQKDADYLNLVDASIPEDADRATATATAPDAPVIALVTDGLANDIRHSEGVRTWLAGQWAAPITAYAMGDSLRYRRRGSHDDRTAVVVWTLPAARSGQSI